MKIGIAGTHSTGKTTLAKEASNKYNIQYLRSDTARDIGNNLTKGLRLDQYSQEEQWKLQQEFLKLTNEIQYSDKSFITDCCSITCDPYSNHLIKDDEFKKTPEYTNFINEAHKGASQLTHLFYTPAEINLIKDGFRPHSEELRKNIDKDLLNSLTNFQFHILTGDIKRRTEQIGLAIGKINESKWNNYIAFEGLPGAGKTTQIKSLENTLNYRGRKVHVCKRFGKPSLKKELNELYKSPIKNRNKLLELHANSFLEQFKLNNVEERLENDEIVITDRQKFSVLAMQLGFGNSHANCYKALKDLPTPGRVLYMDINPHLAVQRRKQEKQGNYLKTNYKYQQRVHDAYQWLSDHHLEFITVNANRPIKTVEKQILTSLNLDYGFSNALIDVVNIGKQYPSQGTKPWDIKTNTMDLQYQIGSLSKLVLQKENYVHNHGLSKQEINSLIALDISDIISLSLIIAKEMNIDPDKVFLKQIRTDLEKIKERTNKK